MSALHEVSERLVTVLEAEEKLYRELRDALQQERAWVVAMDAQNLEALVRRKEALSAEGQLLEESRQVVSLELAGQLGIAGERPTLRALCERLGPEGDSLRRAHARLAALVESVRELVRANEAVAGEALSGVQATLRVLGRLRPDDSSYAAAGAPPTARSGQLVRRTA